MAGALGSHHADIDGRGRVDVVEADVEAVGEEERVTLLQIRRDGLGVQLLLDRIGHRHHDQVGLGRGSGGIDDPKTLLLRLGAALGVRRQADADVDAAVAQAQRVGVTLAAVAHHRDDAVLDDGQVGIAVVEQLGHGELL